MKICSKCKAQLKDDAKFCTKCGNVIAGQAAPAGPDSGRNPSNPQRQPAPQPGKKKSAKPFIIVCCVLIALMVIGTGAFVAVNMRKPVSGPTGIEESKEDEDKTSKEENDDEESSKADASETKAAGEEASLEESSSGQTAAAQTSAAETETTPVFAQSQAPSSSAADWTYPETTAAVPAPTMPATAAANVSYTTYYVVNCNESITLRTSPSTSASEICQIPLGSSVSYVETADNGFYKIIYNGKTGYGLASYLSQDKPSAAGYTGSNTGIYRTFYVVNCNESITLRTSPSTSASEICQIPLGSAVSYVETSSNGFYKVIYNGSTGYALASYLEEY